jgi:hypothetical protein
MSNSNVGMTTANMRRARSAFRGGNLVYPSDIGTTMSRSKHYIQFFVNAQSHASARLGIGAYEGETSMDRTNSNVSVQRAPTKRAVGSIALYMPSQLNVSHKANYGEAEIGALVAGVSNAINTFGSNSDTEGVISALKESAGNLYDAGTAGFAQKLAGLAEGAGATGAVAAVSIAQGKVTNNRTEMKFEGIDRRAFNFSFRLLPRSHDEAEIIQQIISIFRSQAMPEFDQTDSLKRTMIAPSTFDIRYMTIVNGNHLENPALHRIGTCVCEGVDVKYGGDRPQFYYDGQPTETEITLVFKELEIMTKEKINEGY